MLKDLMTISLVAVLGLGMVSCGSDDDSSSNATLEGTWKITTRSYNGVNQELEKCEDLHTISFQGVNFIVTNYNGDDCSEKDVDNGVFTYVGSTLTTTLDSENMEVEVVDLTETKLSIKASDSEDWVEATYLKQ